MEIFQNSIIKLVVRQGPNADREHIILGSGELGYTNDTNRLFVGDGFLSGGHVTGNLFQGSAATITDVSLWPALYGDSAFATDTNKFYILTQGDGSSLSDWLLVGGIYSSGHSQLSISNDNKITLNPISSGFISNDAITSRFYINSGRLDLSPISSGYVSVDALSSPLTLNNGKISLLPISSGYVSVDALSSPLTISNGKISLLPLSSGYFSSDSVEYPIIINNNKISLDDVPIQKVSSKTITSGTGLNIYNNGVLSNGIAFNTLSSDILIESNHIYAKYDGVSDNFINSKGISSYEKLSTGHYRFVFSSTLPIIDYIPITQIIGLNNLSYQARTLAIELSSCDVKIVNSGGSSIDSEIVLHITY